MEKDRIKVKRILYVGFSVSIILCICIFSVMAYIMNHVTKEAVVNISTMYTSEMDTQIQGRFNSVIQVQYNETEKIFSQLNKLRKNGENFRDSLQQSAYVCEFDYLGYITDDREHIPIHGSSIKSEMENPFFNRLSNEKTVGTAENKAGEELFLFVIPKKMTTQEGEKIIAAVSGMRSDIFVNYLSLSIPNTLTHSHILRNRGEYVIHSSERDLKRETFFERLRMIITEDEESVESIISQLREAMVKRQSIAVPARVGKDMQMIYLSSMPVKGWSLCTVLPYGPLNQAIERSGTIRVVTNLLGTLLVIFILAGMFFLYAKIMNQQVTLLTKAREEKQAALEKAQCANSAKSEFLARMSHEIRTPMNGIIGMTTVALQNLSQKDKVLNCLQKIMLSSRQLLSLINDVLDMSKIESGKIEIKKEPFDFRILMENLIKLIAIQAREKQISFEFHISEEIEPVLVGDPLRLNQILMNLFSNALKFTPDGQKVYFNVEHICTDVKEQWIRFQVGDTGKGIAKENFEKIFSAFEQADGSITQEFGGTGLGLSIVKRFTDMMGGKISLESQLGKGSVFIIEMPFGYAGKSVPKLTETRKETFFKTRDEDYDFYGKRILIAEDTPLNVEIICELLRTTGVAIEVANDGEEAVEKFADSAEFYYDVILMDVQMPQMDGYDATKKIRSMDRKDAESVIIFAMTANAFQSDIEKSMECGMNGHLSKPIEVETLYSELAKVL